MASKRILALINLGGLLSFVGFASYVVLVATPLRILGLPPAAWFGSDYTDPRGAVVSGALELFVVGLLSFATALVLNRRFRFATRLEAFCLCDPLSAALGLLLARLVFHGVFPFEFTAPVTFLLLIGWPVSWHLAVLGFRGASWKRAIAVVAAYTVTLLVLGLVHVHRVYVL